MHFPNPKDFTKMGAKFSLHNMFLDWLMDRKAGWTRAKAGDQIKTHLGKMARALYSLSDDVFDKMYDPKNSGDPSDDNRSDRDGGGDVGARYDFNTGNNSARGKDDDGKSRQLYTGADATQMEAALNLCEWKLKHNIKTTAFERLSKLLKKHMQLQKDGSELTETWYRVEQYLNVPDIKKNIAHSCPCDEQRHGHSLEGDWSYDDRCPHYNLRRWTPESLRHPRPATPQPRKFFYDFDVYDMQPKMQKMYMQMAMVALTSDCGRPIQPMLPSAGTSSVVYAN
eukprot:jgi/Tetstr1/445480/TSEL_033258.t1